MNDKIFNICKKDLSKSAPVVKITNLSKKYVLKDNEDSVIALKNINLNNSSEFYPVKKGEFVIIRGPSGGGKTTLLNIIGTLDSNFEGKLEIMEKEITKLSSDNFLSYLRLKEIGFVFQTFNLISTMTAKENVMLPMTIDSVLTKKDQEKRAIELLKSVGLEDRINHLPSELSGGEQQRVAIARSLSNNPSVLLLDEPTGDLDSNSTIEVMNLLLSINKFGPILNNNANKLINSSNELVNFSKENNYNNINTTTIIMVTHNPELECYADRILYVQDGELEKQIINNYQIALTVEEYIEYINKNM